MSKQRLYYVDPVHGGSLVLRADGGDGGAFIIRVSPEARPYMSAAQFENRGGRGGMGAQRGRDGMPGPPPSF